MLDEEGKKSDFVIFDLRKLLRDVIGYEVGAAAARREGKGLLEPVGEG